MTEHNKYYYEFDRNTTDIKEDSRIPNYYVGRHHGYEARKVVEDFELSYNIGTATTYLLRSSNKHKSPQECIKKAIAHLEFELERLKL